MPRVTKHDLIKDAKLLSQLLEANLPPREDLLSGTVIDTVLPIYKNSITLVCAKPKSGKSMFVTHLATNMAKSGHAVLYISLENGSRVDKDRFEHACKLYKLNDKQKENLLYIPFDDGINSQHLGFAAILDFISKPECSFDVIFIDALERVISKGSSGSEISANGYDVLNQLQTTIRNSDSHPALIATWQFSKSGFDKSIETIDMDALGGSIAAVQIAETLWVLKRDNKNKKDWKAKLLASRELSSDDTIVDIYYNKGMNIAKEKNLDELLQETDLNGIDGESNENNSHNATTKSRRL